MANLTQSSTHSGSAVPLIAAAGLLAGVGAALAWAAYSRRRIPHQLPLTAALDAELNYVNTPSAGRIGYYVAGPQTRSRAPLLLVHSVNAAASAFEMRPLFERLARDRRVYALDLPGFGFSNRTDHDYTPGLMRDMLLDFMRLVLKNVPADVAALSLSCEFVALAAATQPDAFRTLTLISPTGMSPRARQVRANEGLLRALRAPSWSRPIFDLLTSRPSLRLFTGQSARRIMPHEFTDYAYTTSHQPDAELAPFAFVAGKLFTPDIFETYESLHQPTLLIYGRDPFAQYDFVDQLVSRKNWRIMPLPRAGALAHWDFPELVTMKIEEHTAA
jgi:pimeloyl-ACP methyl ester carboxylesterase